MDETLVKLGGQVAGLEMVMKAVIPLLLASQVKGDAGFAQAALQAQEINTTIQARVGAIFDNAPPRPGAEEVRRVMEEEVRAMVGRCFDQSAATMTQIAEIVLGASPAASDAKN